MLDANRILFWLFKNGLHDGLRALCIGNGITNLANKRTETRRKSSHFTQRWLGSTIRQDYTSKQNFTYELHGMELTKEEWRVTLISTMKSNPGVNWTVCWSPRYKAQTGWKLSFDNYLWKIGWWFMAKRLQNFEAPMWNDICEFFTDGHLIL